MMPLFFSFVCDYCDGLVDQSDYDVGFVVLRDRPMPSEEYVFYSRQHAERWRDENRLGDVPIVMVRSPHGFSWRKSTGSLEGIVTVDRLVTVYPDHRFPPAPGRAYIAD
jgi:hypothetical protein